MLKKKPQANLQVEDPCRPVKEIVRQRVPTKTIEDVKIDRKNPRNVNPLLTKAEKKEILTILLRTTCQIDEDRNRCKNLAKRVPASAKGKGPTDPKIWPQDLHPEDPVDSDNP